MAVVSIDLDGMAALVRAVEGALRDVPVSEGSVRSQLSGVGLGTSSLAQAGSVVGWAEGWLPDLRRRLALARQIEASTPGPQATITFDDSALTDRTPAEAIQDAREVAAALQEDPNDIPENVFEMLEAGAGDPYFTAALARELPPAELAALLEQREGTGHGILSSSLMTSSDQGDWADWKESQGRLIDALGTAYGTASWGSGDLALSAAWRDEWRDTIEDPGNRMNAPRLTMLMGQGSWSSDLVVDTFLTVEALDHGEPGGTTSGPDYWLEQAGGSGYYYGPIDPRLDVPGYGMAHDPMVGLMQAMAANPQAAVEVFAMPGGDVETLSVDGGDHDVNMFLKYLMLDRDWHGDDGDVLIGAIQAGVTPTDGGSTDSALVAEDVQVVVGWIEEQQEIAAANEPPLWKKIGHGILDVVGFVPVLGEPADLINATWYAADGDYVNAGLSAAGAIPLIGYAAVGGKWVKVTKWADEAELLRLADAGQLARVDPTDLARMADGTEVAPALARFLDTVDIPADAIHLPKGTTGGWNRALNQPLANSTYVVDGRFVYRTDEMGRVTSASGHLDSLPGGARNSYQQGVAGRGDRLPGDEGGHLFGRWFGGPGEGINLVAMNKTTNGAGEFGGLEARWADEIAGGRVVDVDITPVFRGDSLRPDQFVVQWRIDGVPQPRSIFFNP